MFWTNFSKICQARGVAPNAVAAAVGVKSTGTVSGWKRGAMPRDGVLEAIADYFDISVSELIEDKKEKPIAKLSDELSETKREAWELIQKMDEATLRRFIAAAKAMLGE